MNTCAKCRHFEPAGPGSFKNHGRCRALPPTVNHYAGTWYGGLGPEALWPVVHVNDFCASFKRATKQPHPKDGEKP